MARSVMRLGPVHVVVIAPSPSLRQSLVGWLQGEKRVRIVRSVATAAELGPGKVDCDLVVASALEGTRELRAISKRFGKNAGLVALTLGLTPLPAGWAGLRPGASRRHVLDQSIPHPERSVAASWTGISAALAAIAAVAVAFVYVPTSGVSFQRAALAYAERFPDTGTWWHIWGAGAPDLATPEWPLLKIGATIGGAEALPLLAAAVGAVYAIAFLLLALRVGARRWALVATLGAVLPPALWVWPRDGDISSLSGLAAVLLALAGSRVARLRFLSVAIAVVVGSFGGLPWVLGAAVIGAVAGIRDRRGRASVFGAVFGVLMSAAVTLPPFLSRDIEAFRPPLARVPAISDLVPVIASAALVILVTAAGRSRRVPIAIALVALVAANGLALAVPSSDIASIPNVPSTGAFGRLAVHPAQALALAVSQPDLPTTGQDASAQLMLGLEPRDASNATLEWLGADRALLPDRSAGITFNERDWSVIDRERLLLAAPRVRPLLSAAISNTILVVGDAPDAKVFGDALVHAGVPSDVVIPVRANKLLDELDSATLQQFTVLAVYGQPWRDRGKAQKVLDGFLQQTGFVFMDTAARAGAEPVLPEAKTIRADDLRVVGSEPDLISGDAGYDGRAVAVDQFTYANDPTWERAALVAGDKRLIQFGRVKVPGSSDTFAHMVWSGVDLPRRAVAEDPHALRQLSSAFQWLLSAAATAANLPQQPPFTRPTTGDTLDSDAFTTSFLSPTHWRIAMKQQTTGVLFKERWDDQWRAFQVDLMPLTQQESRTALHLWETTHGYMYVNLTPNARVVDFEIERHPLEPATRAVSAIALFAVLGVSFFQLRHR